jgi:general secretion pathway protein G
MRRWRMRLLAVLAVSAWALGGCGYTPAAEVELTKEAMKDVVGALDAFKKDQKRYPEKLADLVTKPKYLDPKTTKWPSNGYIKKVPGDAWGREFIYRAPGMAGKPFDLISQGQDGKPGGKKDDQDLSHFPLPTPRK